MSSALSVLTRFAVFAPFNAENMPSNGHGSFNAIASRTSNPQASVIADTSAVGGRHRWRFAAQGRPHFAPAFGDWIETDTLIAFKKCVFRASVMACANMERILSRAKLVRNRNSLLTKMAFLLGLNDDLAISRVNQ